LIRFFASYHLLPQTRSSGQGFGFNNTYRLCRFRFHHLGQSLRRVDHDLSLLPPSSSLPRANTYSDVDNERGDAVQQRGGRFREEEDGGED
jgi:hypothetical protein